MNFLRDYSHDVFVSYAHGPKAQGRYSSERHNLLSGWTHRFIDDLVAQVDFNLSQVEGDTKTRVNFFMDPDLESGGSIAENLREKARSSALFLVVMSPTYLKSSWCTDEIDWFLSGLSEDNPELRRFTRIFVAHIIPTDRTTWPNGLKDEFGKSIWGHLLHAKNERNPNVVPFGWPSPDTTVKEYWSEIVRLAGDMTAKLRRLKELERRSAKESKTEASTAAAEPIEPAFGRQVFLGYTHDTLIPVRSELRRELTKLGLQVLPPENDDPWDEASLRQRLNTYLDQAHVMALCANQYCGTWPRDQNGGFVSLQVQRAKERVIPCQLWLSWDQRTEPQTPEYKRFLQDLIEQSKNSALGIKLDHQSVPDFAEHIRDTVNQEVVIPGGVRATSRRLLEPAHQIGGLSPVLRYGGYGYQRNRSHFHTSELRECERTYSAQGPGKRHQSCRYHCGRLLRPGMAVGDQRDAGNTAVAQIRRCQTRPLAGHRAPIQERCEP